MSSSPESGVLALGKAHDAAKGCWDDQPVGEGLPDCPHDVQELVLLNGHYSLSEGRLTKTFGPGKRAGGHAN